MSRDHKIGRSRDHKIARALKAAEQAKNAVVDLKSTIEEQQRIIEDQRSTIAQFMKEYVSINALMLLAVAGTWKERYAAREIMRRRLGHYFEEARKMLEDERAILQGELNTRGS